MSEAIRPPMWLRGEIADVPISMQPVAHALLNMLEEVEEAAQSLSATQLWESVGGAASVGFHLQHLAGSTSRLFTYARGEMLSEQQRTALADEKNGAPNMDVTELLRNLRQVVHECLGGLRHLDESLLDTHRGVGRAAHRSSVRGILHHAAEHAARHSGQVITTARIVSTKRPA